MLPETHRPPHIDVCVLRVRVAYRVGRNVKTVSKGQPASCPSQDAGALGHGCIFSRDRLLCYPEQQESRDRRAARRPHAPPLIPAPRPSHRRDAMRLSLSGLLRRPRRARRRAAAGSTVPGPGPRRSPPYRTARPSHVLRPGSAQGGRARRSDRHCHCGGPAATGRGCRPSHPDHTARLGLVTVSVDGP
eukprot:509022-Hanusia_phi.AAC.1